MFKTKEPSLQDWNRLVKEGFSFDGNSNTKEEFGKMSKKFGLAFIFYVEAAYSIKDEMTDEEFCKLNGNVPAKFLEKFKCTNCASKQSANG